MEVQSTPTVAETGLESGRSELRKPDFFLVGAAKAGTTSLFQYLVQHPRIFIPSIKEPHYFSEFYDAGAPHCRTIEEYLRLYSECAPRSLAGDASTSYLYSRSAAASIREFQPRAKIIAILRNPVDRAYSSYWYNRRNFVENLSFEDALAAEPERIRAGEHYRFHYFQSGLYSAQVRRYQELFGREATRFYLFEDLSDARALCRGIFHFLGVDAAVPIETEKRFNPSGPIRSRLLGRLLNHSFPRLRSAFPRTTKAVKYRLLKFNVRPPSAMDPGTRERLEASFREDILKLEALIDRDLSHWRH